MELDDAITDCSDDTKVDESGDASESALLDSSNPEASDNFDAINDNGDGIIFEHKPKSSKAKKHRIRVIHIKYDFVGFIPIKSLMQYAEDAKASETQEIPA